MYYIYLVEVISTPIPAATLAYVGSANMEIWVLCIYSAHRLGGRITVKCFFAQILFRIT